MPDGRVLLYDTGSMRGPDVTARVVAPFLWSRKIRRIDDVVLSHADLDHFNGLADLVDRFAIGRVLCSSTFEDKATAGVRHTLRELQRRGVPIDHLVAGQRLLASGVVLEVLHPPAGFEGSNENSRSIVLEVKHGGHVLLLTGDLEGEGLAEVLSLPRRRVDVLAAPHHGSHRIDVTALATWCRPGLVVSCQGAPRARGGRRGCIARAGRNSGARMRTARSRFAAMEWGWRRRLFSRGGSGGLGFAEHHFQPGRFFSEFARGLRLFFRYYI